MPVILENGSEEIQTWLDPKRSTWSKDLQSLLKPFNGELEVYPVSKDVGKVGNNSPSFIIPIASTENKSNIANFFAKGAAKKESKGSKDSTATKPTKSEEPADVKKEESTPVKHESDENRNTIDHEGTEDNAPLPVPKSETKKGIKRELDDVPDQEAPHKLPRTSARLSTKQSPSKPSTRSRSATSNNTASPKKPKAKEKGSQKITSFFAK
jgi:preprotein translocase subunit SecD